MPDPDSSFFDPDAPRPDPNFQPPNLSTEVKEGWRSWSVHGERPKWAQPKLYSVAGTHGYFWKPRIESTAECSRGCNKPDGVGIPGEHCSCGFYSAKSRQHLLSLGYHTYDGEQSGMYCVIGRVANWGKVIEGSLGWRAEKSYPLELFIPYEIWPIAKPLADAYGVPVKLDNFLKPTPGSEYL